MRRGQKRCSSPNSGSQWAVLHTRHSNGARRTVCSFAVLAVVTACAEPPSAPVESSTGGAGGWPGIGSAWGSAHDGSIYSLSFFDAPPDGIYVRSVSYASSPGDTCEVFAKEQYLQASSERDDWVLLLQVSRNVVGTFRVQPDDRTGAELTAQVLVKHIVRGKEVERHTGLAGTAVVTEVADSIGAKRRGLASRSQRTSNSPMWRRYNAVAVSVAT